MDISGLHDRVEELERKRCCYRNVFNEEYTDISSTYTLANVPKAGTLRVYRNGVKLNNSEFSHVEDVVTPTTLFDLSDVYSNDYQI